MKNTVYSSLEIKAPFRRERNRPISFRIVPKSGTLKGSVQTVPLQIELIRSKNGSTR